nr:NACHT, LRR and PYD domains-containing protein 1b allele 2-like isoform X1 [Pelodiscus sinensis]|eukprot:XP_014425797.1 NACHT, LRR and PYD domains-containing protein 1b allele 2-like isoform X1 [Pelodiscus sinensis]
MTPERPTSINRFFAVLKNPNFSQLGVVWRKLRSAFKFIPIHSLVLIYRTLSMADVTLHLYLIPNDHSLQKAIEGKETTWKSTHVPKPPQTDPLYFGSRYQVSGLENLQITPAQLDFCYRSPGEQQSFVEIYTREMKKEIRLQVQGQEDGSLVWETLVRPGDVRLPASPSLGLPGQCDFFLTVLWSLHSLCPFLSSGLKHRHEGTVSIPVTTTPLLRLQRGIRSHCAAEIGPEYRELATAKTFQSQEMQSQSFKRIKQTTKCSKFLIIPQTTLTLPFVPWAQNGH